MVESGPGLRSGLTADIRACLKMHLKIKKGEESSQSKLKAKQRKCLQSSWLQKGTRNKELRMCKFQRMQVSEGAGLTACTA